MVNLAGAVVSLVDGGDLAAEHEANRLAAQRRGQAVLDAFAQAVKAGLGFLEAFLQMRQPGGVGDVTGAQQADALAASPIGQVGQLQIPAACPGVLGVNVQIGYPAARW